MLFYVVMIPIVAVFDLVFYTIKGIYLVISKIERWGDEKLTLLHDWARNI